MQQPQTQLLARERPIRIAYFVDLSETSHPILDAIFRFSYSHWGGRFSLIVPCRDNAPLPTFLPWLKTFDPDLIYSYVDLSVARQNSLHEDLYPSALQRHRLGPDHERQNYHPSVAISPLSAVTLIPLAAAPGWPDGTRGVRILNTMGSLAENRLLSDSFGVAGPPVQMAMRSSLSDLGSNLIAIADGELEPRRQWVRRDERVVSNVNDILTDMAVNRRVIGVSRLSSMMTPRLDLTTLGWSESFNLVVGDTVADRLIFWNARALTPSHRDASDVDMCVPRQRFDDLGFVDALGQFLNARNFMNGQNNNGPNRVTLRSTSLDADTLREMAGRFVRQRNFNSFNHEVIASVENCVPEPQAMANANFVVGQRGFWASSSWSESYSIGDELRFKIPSPDHLRHAPATLMDQASGAWAVDMDIERTVNHSPYDNIVHRWRLPRRLRLTGSFLCPYQMSQPLGSQVHPRVSSGGLLSLFADASTVMPAIHRPTDDEAIEQALTRGRDWAPFEHFGNREMLPQICADARRSSAGRQFWGAYHMLGDLNGARRFLLHEFWRTQLDHYDATSRRTEVRRESIEQRLVGRLGNQQVDLRQPRRVEALANIVLQEADEVRLRVISRSWTDFYQDFLELVARDEEANPPPEAFAQGELEDEVHRRADGLRQMVQDLCSRGVLHQGYDSRCHKCLHRSWISIANLTGELVCEVCGDCQPPPVDQPWAFRLNGFMREALRSGVGPLFWVLSRLQSRNNTSFWFEGPLDVFFGRDAAEAGLPDTDIDLTMIDNGLVRMCEVKSSTRGFDDPERLAADFSRLRPDIAMIAVMETLNPALQTKFDAFSAALVGTNIQPELLTLLPEDISSLPYFF